MSTEQAIDDLMLRWETARQDGKTVSADELCHDCPEFASELRQRIRAVLAMEGVLGVTDHDPNRTFIDEPAGDTTPHHRPRRHGRRLRSAANRAEAHRRN
jgi:hypothetical protein